MIKFSRTQRFTKENISQVPENKAIVYKIKGRGSDNLYTGITGRGRVEDRLLEHKNLRKDVIPGGTKFQYAQVKTKERAEQVEKQIIRKEQPKFNEQNK
jgi:hypothetical protein